VTSLDLHATEIAADRAVHPSTGSGQAFTDWLAHVRNSAFHRLRLCLPRPGPALNLATTRPTARASAAARRAVGWNRRLGRFCFIQENIRI